MDVTADSDNAMNHESKDMDGVSKDVRVQKATARLGNVSLRFSRLGNSYYSRSRARGEIPSVSRGLQGERLSCIS